MLYVVGGAARSGKSVVARVFLHQQGVPYFSLDFLMMGLAGGAPQLGVSPDVDNREVAVRMWPVLRNLAINIIEEGADYLIEGDSVLPRHIAELASLYAGRLRPCFLGYPNALPAEKLRQLQVHRGYANEWLDLSDERVALLFLESMIRFSADLAEECRELGIPFFDVSHGLPGALDPVLAYLSTGRGDR